MATDFPWYEIVTDDSLRQGDIFSGYPLLYPDAPPDFIEIYLQGESLPDVPVVPISSSVIIVTQSCDLENKDVDTVVLCPLWSRDEVEKEYGWRKDKLNNIRKGREYQWHMINSSDNPDTEISIVEFQRIYTTSKPALSAFAEKTKQHIRLLPPYREHFSQAFARYFMRVALPDDIPAI